MRPDTNDAAASWLVLAINGTDTCGEFAWPAGPAVGKLGIDFEHIPKCGGSTWGQLFIRQTLGTFPRTSAHFQTFLGGSTDMHRALGSS